MSCNSLLHPQQYFFKKKEYPVFIRYSIAKIFERMNSIE
jgi:hypothetical protein